MGEASARLLGSRVWPANQLRADLSAYAPAADSLPRSQAAEYYVEKGWAGLPDRFWNCAFLSSGPDHPRRRDFLYSGLRVSRANGWPPGAAFRPVRAGRNTAPVPDRAKSTGTYQRTPV